MLKFRSESMITPGFLSRFVVFSTLRIEAEQKLLAQCVKTEGGRGHNYEWPGAPQNACACQYKDQLSHTNDITFNIKQIFM